MLIHRVISDFNVIVEFQSSFIWYETVNQFHVIIIKNFILIFLIESMRYDIGRVTFLDLIKFTSSTLTHCVQVIA